MIKRIKEWIATNRKLKDKKKEREFKEKLDDAYLYSCRLDKLQPNAAINWQYNKNGEKEIVSMTSWGYIFPESEAIKYFIERGGIILHKDDEWLYKKVKWLNKHNIEYLITEDKEELEYNIKEIDYGL